MKILTRQVETLGYNAVLKSSKKLDSKLKNKNLEALSMGIGRQNDLLRRLSSECPNCGCRNTDRGKIGRLMYASFRCGSHFSFYNNGDTRFPVISSACRLKASINSETRTA